jgi:predicted acetyltransferase
MVLRRNAALDDTRRVPDLSRPHVRYQESFLEAMQEFVEEGWAGTDSMIAWDLDRFGDSWHTEEGFAAYVEATLAEAVRPRQPGFVCQTSWWWTEGDQCLGRISLRHELTPHLLEVGGHIGYGVRRSRRREGHATRMLAAVLREAAARGIDPALLTCDADNAGSQAVIERNGGVLEDQRGVKLRYWLPTGLTSSVGS